MKDNARFDRVCAPKGVSKRWKNAPNYWGMHKYAKSRHQYVKERARRKQARELSSQGYRYEDLAKKLGVSVKNVQRDMKKPWPCIKGQMDKRWRESEEEEHKELCAKVEGLSLYE